MPTSSFADVMGRLRAGDARAATQVFERFAQRLIGLARRRLNRRLRNKVDPEDVLQSAFRSFFGRQEQFQFADWDSLWALLVVLTWRKCARQADLYGAARRAVEREVPSARELEAMDREPSPAEAAVLADTVAELLRRSAPRDRPILELSLQGYTGLEVSEQAGCTERTVRRVLARARDRLQELDNGSS